MAEDLSSQKTESTPEHEHVSLTDLLAVRIAYERVTADMHACLIAKCRKSKDPVIRAMDLTRLEQFQDALTSHVQLLTQAIDVIGSRTNNKSTPQPHEPFLILMKAAQQQACDPDVPVLPSLQAVMIVQQFNDMSWGLLLALLKDMELQRFATHVEQICARHHGHRTDVQQLYEDVALGLVRREQLNVRAPQPLKSGLSGRIGLLFADRRHLGRA